MKIIAEAAPITAKKDEYTGAAGSDISRVFYKEKRVQCLVIVAEYTQQGIQWPYAVPYIEISQAQFSTDGLWSCDEAL